MIRRSLLLGAVTALLASFTYHGLWVLVASNRLRALAPGVANSMKRISDEVAGKVLVCSIEEETRGPGRISSARLQELNVDYGPKSFAADYYNRRSQVGVEFGSKVGLTDGIRELFLESSGFGYNFNEWLTACERGPMTSGQQQVLSRDAQEMADIAEKYQAAVSKCLRQARAIAAFVWGTLGLDVLLVFIIVRAYTDRFRASVRRSQSV